MANGTSLTTTASQEQADLENRSGALVRPEVDRAAHRSKRFHGWLALMVVVPVGFAAWGVWWWLVSGSGLSSQITAAVTRGTLAVHILAGGELESAKTVDVFCEVEGQQIKIVEMLPEGTVVTKGQVIVRLDPSDVNQRLARQQIVVMKAQATAKQAQEELKIQNNMASSRIAQAELTLTLSQLDKKKYLEGDYMVAEKDLQGSIALAQTELQEAQDTLKYFHDLVKKGFRTPEQLRAKEQDVMRARYNLGRDQEKLRVLENFTHQRQLVELEANVREAKREIDRAKSSSEAAIVKSKTDMEAAVGTARLETQQMDKLQQQLDHCDVRAPLAGTLVYAKQHGQETIELGSAVHYKQKLFSLPDMTRMQVKVFVHESLVKKVRPGMAVLIRTEAYPDMALSGTVQSIATFYDAIRHWWSGGVKEYVAMVKIDQLPGSELKPGMTAQATILAAELTDTLMIPIQAVAQRGDQYFCYVIQSDTAQRRPITVGQSNDNMIQVLDGLKEQEQVTLDARVRLAAELPNGSAPGGAGSNM